MRLHVAESAGEIELRRAIGRPAALGRMLCGLGVCLACYCMGIWSSQFIPGSAAYRRVGIARAVLHRPVSDAEPKTAIDSGENVPVAVDDAATVAPPRNADQEQGCDDVQPDGRGDSAVVRTARDSSSRPENNP